MTSACDGRLGKGSTNGLQSSTLDSNGKHLNRLSGKMSSSKKN